MRLIDISWSASEFVDHSADSICGCRRNGFGSRAMRISHPLRYGARVAHTAPSHLVTQDLLRGFSEVD